MHVDGQKHRHTDHATCDVCSIRPHQRTAVMRCGRKKCERCRKTQNKLRLVSG